MSVATAPAATPGRRRDRRRKLRAVLAAGLVLGIGGAVTLAAWNDSEYATGTFTAGTFNMQGTIDNTTWAEHSSPLADANGPAALTFTAPFSNMSPNTTVYAPFAVRLAAGTTTGATVSIPAPTLAAGTAGVGLTYSLIQPSAFGCTSGTTGTTLVPTGTLLTAGSATTFTLTQGAGASPGGSANLCFVVTADQTLPQGQVTTVTWRFLATST